MVKECTKEIAQYRVNRGHGVSEDYMILGKLLVLYPLLSRVYQFNFVMCQKSEDKEHIFHKPPKMVYIMKIGHEIF